VNVVVAETSPGSCLRAVLARLVPAFDHEASSRRSWRLCKSTGVSDPHTALYISAHQYGPESSAPAAKVGSQPAEIVLVGSLTVSDGAFDSGSESH